MKKFGRMILILICFSFVVTYIIYETGYYDREDSRGKVRKICKTLQTLLDTLELFPEHREELLEMFNYKMSNLKNPKLWENYKQTE